MGITSLGRAVHKLAGDDPARQLPALLDVMDLWFNHPDFHGCMFVNAALEFPNPHDPIHKAAAAFKYRTREHRRSLARAAGADSAAAETFADCYTALIEGAFILRQTQARNDAARVVRPAVEQLIRAYLPSAPGNSKPRTRTGRSRQAPKPRNSSPRRRTRRVG